MKLALVVVSVLLSLVLYLPLTAQADDPSICIRLTPGGPAVDPIAGAPVVILDVFASNKAGSTSTVYALNGTASSTQATNPPTELFYLVSGTAYITTKSAAELSLAGTAEDVEGIKEVVFHVVIDGKDDRYTQIIRNSGGNGSAVLTGVAELSQSCGKKK